MQYAERMERRRRKQNLIVHGLWIKSEDHETIKDNLRQLFKDVFKERFPIQNVTKINNALFIVKMLYLRHKVYILRNKHLLIQGNYAFNPVKIYNDLTTEERNVGYRISQRAEKEKLKGNNVRIGYMKLYINNQKWTWSAAKNDLVPPRIS